MHKQPKHYFEAILGIRAPWSIQEVVCDEKNKVLQVELSCIIEKSKFSFFSKNTETQGENIVDAGVKKRWMHSPVGSYSCQIISRFEYKTEDTLGISKDVLSHPSFVGESQRSYTHQLRQDVAISQARGLTAKSIAQMLRVEQTVVDDILRDIERTPESYRLAACLPTETDSIWSKIITDKILLKTQVFPLKLLLSKLKLTFFDSQSEDVIAGSIVELRKFFIAQVPVLEAEYSQICAFDVKKQVAEERQTTAATKLVLPSLKNAIWQRLISGKINLQSSNVSLNLILMRSRHAFNNSTDNHNRVLVLHSLREYFRKNARLLKPELVLINQLMNAPEEAQFTLPDENHEVWRKILRDDTFIPSSYVAYKMLLANLRSQLLMNPEPVVEINAARKVRDFIKQNQRFMQQEFSLLLKKSYA